MGLCGKLNADAEEKRKNKSEIKENIFIYKKEV
jgi:hypothetical protein